MVPKCHPIDGATFTTSKDQIYISFTLDRKLLQSFTSGDEESPQLELLLMNKVLTECLGSLTMAYHGPVVRKNESEEQVTNSKRHRISHSSSVKRRKLSKLRDDASDSSSRCDSDDESDISPLCEMDALKENMLCTRNKVFDSSIPSKLLEFASVQNVVSDLAAAAAKDNNNLPLNLSSKELNNKKELSTTDKVLDLAMCHIFKSDFSEATKIESGITDSDTDDDLNSKCQSPEPDDEELNETLNESRSLLSPSLLVEDDDDLPQTSTTTCLENDDIGDTGTAVVTPAAAPSGPVPKALGLLDDCNNLKYTQTLNDIILEGMTGEKSSRTNSSSNKSQKENPKTSNPEVPRQCFQPGSTTSAKNNNAAALGFFNAAHLLSSANLLTAAQNVSYQSALAATAAAAAAKSMKHSTNATAGVPVSTNNSTLKSNNATHFQSSPSHQLSSLIASLSNSSSPSSLLNNNSYLSSSTTKMSSSTVSSVSERATNSASPACTTNASNSPTSSVTSSSSTGLNNNCSVSTPRRGQKSLQCEYGCGYETPDATLLKSHHVSHSNDRPYQCSYCGHSFKRNHTLLRHIRQVHKIDTTSATGESVPVMNVASMVAPQTSSSALKSSTSSPSMIASQNRELSSFLHEKLKSEFNNSLMSGMKQTAMSQASAILANLSNKALLKEEDLDFKMDTEQKPMNLAMSAAALANRTASPKPPSLLHCSEYAVKRSLSPVSLLDLARPQLTNVVSASTQRASDPLNMSMKHHHPAVPKQSATSSLNSLNLVMSM